MESYLSAKDIQSVSSYILTLEGSNPPDAKAAEGEIWAETGDAAAVPATVVDSTNVEAPAKE